MDLQGWLLTSCPALLLWVTYCNPTLGAHQQPSVYDGSGFRGMVWTVQALQQTDSMNRHRWGQMMCHLVNKNPINNTLDSRTAAEQWWGEVLPKLFTQLDAKPCTPLPCSSSPAEKSSSSAPDWNEHWIEWWGMLRVLPLCFNWQCHLQHWLTGSSLDPEWCCPWCLMASLCLFFCLSNQVFTHSPSLYYLPHACCRKIGSGVISVVLFGF